MENKSLVIYAGAVVIIIAAILIFNSSGDQGTMPVMESPSGEMPNDDIHKGMSSETPSSGNVKSEFMQRYNSMKEKYTTNPSDTAVAKEYAVLLAQAHRKSESIDIFNGILEKDPARTDILLILGFQYYGMKEYDKALDATKQLLRYDNNNAQAKYNLGAISEAMGKIDDARKYWEEVVKKYPDTEAAKFAERSLQSLDEGKES